MSARNNNYLRDHRCAQPTHSQVGQASIFQRCMDNCQRGRISQEWLHDVAESLYCIRHVVDQECEYFSPTGRNEPRVSDEITFSLTYVYTSEGLPSE